MSYGRRNAPFQLTHRCVSPKILFICKISRELAMALRQGDKCIIVAVNQISKVCEVAWTEILSESCVKARQFMPPHPHNLLYEATTCKE
jgi:hypothetical protein